MPLFSQDNLKTSKSKNKKKHGQRATAHKVTMSLDEFVGPRDDNTDYLQATGGSTMDCMDDIDDDLPPFTRSSNSKDQLETFDGIFTNDTVSLTSSDSQNEGSKTADIKDTLFSYV